MHANRGNGLSSKGGAKVEVIIEVAVPNLVTDNSKKLSIFVAIFKNHKNMTKEELIHLLAEEHNEQTIKLLRDFPTLTRDLYVMIDYEASYRHYTGENRRTAKQWSRDHVLERYNMGKNTFYKVRKRVEWILERMPG